jgi:HK97 family phage major capsid protein
LQESGWVLPASLDPAVIIANSGSISPVRALSRNVTTATSTWRGLKTTGATAEWKAESTQAADGTPTASEIEIPLFASSCYMQWSWEVRFSASNLNAQLEVAIADALSNQLNVAWITGNGTTQPQGLVTGLAGSASEINTLGTETYASTDPTRLQAALPARYSAGAAWLSHLATKNAYAFLETTNGALLFPELRNDPPTLLTKPWYEASDMDGALNPAVTANNYVLVCGDLRQGYITVDGVGSVAEIYNVTGANGRPTGDSGLIVWSRHGAEVVNIDAFRLLDIPTTA